MFEDKKVVIWGTGKFQKDFQYIFEDIVPAYYITEENEDSGGDCPKTSYAKK